MGRSGELRVIHNIILPVLIEPIAIRIMVKRRVLLLSLI